MAKGAEEFNIPAFRENRELVASEDGGLKNPSVLVFDSSWGENKQKNNAFIQNKALDASEKFNYPSHGEVKRPSKDEDIAFMTVSSISFDISFSCLASNASNMMSALAEFF